MFQYILKKIAAPALKAPQLSWKTSTFGSNLRFLYKSFKQSLFPNKNGALFQRIMQEGPDEKKAKLACSIFERETGIKMLMTHPGEAYSFQNNCWILSDMIKKGDFPNDIKYVIIGHGSGTSVNNTWHVAKAPEIKIFDFIKENIPKGEKVLVNCCEETPDELKYLIPKDKPGIGNVASEFYNSYSTPAKIVVSGEDKICGAFANGIATYY